MFRRGTKILRSIFLKSLNQSSKFSGARRTILICVSQYAKLKLKKLSWYYISYQSYQIDVVASSKAQNNCYKAFSTWMKLEVLQQSKNRRRSQRCLFLLLNTPTYQSKELLSTFSRGQKICLKEIWHVLSSCRMLSKFLVRFSKWLQSVKKVL